MLNKYMEICGSHEPVSPVLPKEGESLQFEAWAKT